ESAKAIADWPVWEAMVKENPTDLDSRFRGNDACSGCSEPAGKASFRPSEARAGIRDLRGGSVVIRAKQSAHRNSALLSGFPFLTVVLFMLGILPASGFSQSQLPEGVRNVGIDQRLNEQLPLDLEFHDEEGRTVTIGQFFRDKPVVLSLVY